MPQAQHVLELCLARDPSLTFDVINQLRPAPTAPPVSGQPTWCICQRCREMPSVEEKKCCNQQPPGCISTLPHMDNYILLDGVLCLARRIWNKLCAVADLPDPGEDNRQFRHDAYRQYVAWHYGILGPSHPQLLCVVHSRYSLSRYSRIIQWGHSSQSVTAVPLVNCI